MRDFFLDILQIPKLIEYTTSPRDLLRKHMMCNETIGSQDEKENLDDVRGEELSKAMKTMSIGDIMPREEEDDEGPSISIQANSSTSTTNGHNEQEGNSSNNDSPQEDDQMASMTTPSTSTQEPIDQPRIHHQVAKDHPIDQIMGDISKGVSTLFFCIFS
jgi:hypothetical protein